MAQDHPRQVYELGLAMAGAISAGAYSAGVLDFLAQALDEWERAKVNGADADSVPNHSVVIKVVSGASAGALTGALGAAALAGGLRPQPFSDPPPNTQPYRCVLPTLYRAWVTEPCMVSPDGGPDLLGTSDLGERGRPIPPVVSLLDCGLLDHVKQSALTLAAPQAPPVPYVAEKLHVYMTVSNLRGVPYSMRFTGGEHGMMCHGDRVHYVLTGLGSTPLVSPFADADSGLPLDASELFGPTGPSSDWLTYGDVALASAAFPAGLAPRTVSAALSTYRHRLWPLDVPASVTVQPKWPSPWGDAEDRIFTFLNVDGGLINNEPFEYARYTLREDKNTPNPRKGSEATRSVLLIDPFPEPPDFPPDNTPASGLASVIAALFPVMKNQARFKPSELFLAADDETYTRYLIAPHRTLPNKAKEETYAIACGLLGGFGGFLDERFRAHDFQLGRRNCQRFLREVLTLPGDNAIVKTWTEVAKADPRFQAAPRSAGQAPEFTVIPLLGSAAAEVELPPWPRLGRKAFDRLQHRIEGRVEALAPALIRQQTASRKLRAALKLALWFGEAKILDYAKHAILSDLIRRDQSLDFSGLAPQDPASDPWVDEKVRKVLAALANPSFDYRTIPGLRLATGLSQQDIEGILGKALQARDEPWSIRCDEHSDFEGNTLYTLCSRKPSKVWRMPIFRSVERWLSEPVIG